MGKKPRELMSRLKVAIGYAMGSFCGAEEGFALPRKKPDNIMVIRATVSVDRVIMAVDRKI